jgi:hypothetical protein
MGDADPVVVVEKPAANTGKHHCQKQETFHHESEIPLRTVGVIRSKASGNLISWLRQKPPIPGP